MKETRFFSKYLSSQWKLIIQIIQGEDVRRVFQERSKFRWNVHPDDDKGTARLDSGIFSQIKELLDLIQVFFHKSKITLNWRERKTVVLQVIVM